MLLVHCVLLDFATSPLALFIWLCTPTMCGGGGVGGAVALHQRRQREHCYVYDAACQVSWGRKKFRENIDLWLWLYPITMEIVSNYLSNAL